MLAEGVHSIADTASQALLLLGMTLAPQRPVALPAGAPARALFLGVHRRDQARRESYDAALDLERLPQRR
jgi:hypothetical protein